MKNLEEKIVGIYEKAQEAKSAIYNPTYASDVVYHVRWLSYIMQEAIDNGISIEDRGNFYDALYAIKKIDSIILDHLENCKKYISIIDMSLKEFEESIKKF